MHSVSPKDPSLETKEEAKKEEKEPLDTKKHKPSFLFLAFNSLGIVFGDIGTSPLYVLKTVFSSPPSPEDTVGAVSLVLYSLFIIATIKYILFILHADNKGEGGTFALYGLLKEGTSALLMKKKKLSKLHRIITAAVEKVGPFMAIVSAAFIMGDGSLTPAISILSAIEGIDVATPALREHVVLIATLVIVVVFLLQQLGTTKMGLSYAPISLLWFISLAGMGIYNVLSRPTVFNALNPATGVNFLVRGPPLISLGGVFLSVSGVEALYADLGHFGKWPIRAGWLVLVFPSLVLNYLGQGALLLSSPRSYTNAFFFSIPQILFWPVLVLATLATIIASQAMITGCFSLVSQAISLDFTPPLRVIHSSKRVYGQVYVPVINFLLMIISILIVIGFRTSAAIANAYGVTVSGVSLITTVMFCATVLYSFKWRWWFAVAFLLFFGLIDGAFFAANLLKIPAGGWVSLLLGFIFGSIMVSWMDGSANTQRYFDSHKPGLTLQQVSERLIYKHPVCIAHDDGKTISISEAREKHPMIAERRLSRFPRMGVFVSATEEVVPPAFSNLISYMYTIPELVVFLTVHTDLDARVDPKQRLLKCYNEGEHFYRVVAKIGYMESRLPVEDILEMATKEGLPVVERHMITYFLHRDHITVTSRSPLHFFTFRIYVILKNLFPNMPSNFQLPQERIVEIGIRAIL